MTGRAQQQRGDSEINEQLLTDLQAELAATQSQLQTAQEQARRAVADYQNLQRRVQEDRLKLVKLATQELVSELLQPLDHLSLAAEQLQDQGLNMVITQLWQTLENQGLQKLDVLGKPFDVATMEAVDAASTGDVVIKVHTAGYTLNGELIKHAKVVLGEPTVQESVQKQ